MVETASLTVFAVTFAVLLASVPPMIKSLRLYRRHDRFRCTSCGDCCRIRIIPISREDIRRLEAAGYRDFTAERGEPAMRRVNGRCVFLKDDRCSVYEHRPRVCREFPFFRVYGVGYAERASFCPALEELEHG